MNILYVEFYKYGTWKYELCVAPAVYFDIYTQIMSWGSEDHRKMNLLAVF